MKKRLNLNAFLVLFLVLGIVLWLAGCQDNSVGPETIAPSMPTNLVATAVDSTTIDLTWTASTDNVVVCWYNVYRGSLAPMLLIGTSRTNSFRDSTVAPGSAYAYAVEALDCSQNASPLSVADTSDTTTGTPPPDTGSGLLRSAATYGILAGQTITNTGPTQVIGDMGLSPGSAVTGFPPGTYTGTLHINDVAANKAKLDLTNAYLNLAGRAPGASVAGNIGGQTLTPGTYTSSSTLAISSGDLTLDGQGDANAVFIFQIASALTTTSGRQVILIGSAQAKNVYWQVGSDATLGTTSVFQGNILALSSITLLTGATLDGRAFARNGSITLDNNIVTVP